MPTSWKYHQFYDILNDKKFFSVNDENDKKCHRTINTFISIGDSQHEYYAAGVLKHLLEENSDNHTFIHRVKFIETPSLNDLCFQQTKMYESCSNFEHYSMQCRNKDILY